MSGTRPSVRTADGYDTSYQFSERGNKSRESIPLLRETSQRTQRSIGYSARSHGDNGRSHLEVVVWHGVAASGEQDYCHPRRPSVIMAFILSESPAMRTMLSASSPVH